MPLSTARAFSVASPFGLLGPIWGGQAEGGGGGGGGFGGAGGGGGGGGPGDGAFPYITFKLYVAVRPVIVDTVIWMIVLAGFACSGTCTEIDPSLCLPVLTLIVDVGALDVAEMVTAVTSSPT